MVSLLPALLLKLSSKASSKFSPDLSQPSLKPPSLLAQAAILFAKDMRLELRTRSMSTSMGVYALLVLTIYGAALSQTSDAFDILQIASGLLWALILFTALLGLNRSFAHEQENGCFEGLLIAPLERPALFLAKAAANFVFIFAVELMSVPLFFFFFLGGTELAHAPLLLLLPLVVGSLGIAGVGTLFATITLNISGKDMLLAILLIPVIFPLLYVCVSATSVIFVGAPDGLIQLWRSLLLGVGYDVIMFGAAYALYEFVVSA